MYCKCCGRPKVKVGKYCSHCGTYMEPLPTGWLPIEPRSSFKTKEEFDREEPTEDLETLLVKAEAKRELANTLSVIIKILGFLVFWPIILLIAFFSNDWSSLEVDHRNERSTNAQRNSVGSHSCDGDCANCPPHYGYRYGRWYYGHGHRHGCQRGGNGGASGRCHRD